MTIVRKFTLVFSFIVLCGATSFGETSSAEKKVVYKKAETHKFSGLKLKGEFKKPDLSYIYQRKGIRSEQIIDIPDDFNAQIREDGHGF